jgi:GH15 family glucan-1,4-alpha-glucosidase
MHLVLTLRFDYGSVVPWVQRIEGGITAIAGPDLARLITPVELIGKDLSTVADFEVSEGQRIPFVLTHSTSFGPQPNLVEPESALEQTEKWWIDWVSRCSYNGEWRGPVIRSLITLKALTYAPTGGIVAAPTTSLPEQIGGVRNWDYRICWVRDASFTLFAMANAGYLGEAQAWRGWLQRAVAGTPDTLQIMYALDGTRRIVEIEIPWLKGYENSTPVRVGNAAYQQFQLDVFGELAATMYECRRAGLEPSETSWAMGKALYESLEKLWREPDDGIWEIRGPRRHFTHSKIMAWVAFDRAVKTVEEFHLDGPVDRWRATRDEIHAEVCREGYNQDREAFVQSYGSDQLDASLLLIPLVGFLPASDPRVKSTVEAIERELSVDGFVRRYLTTGESDGLPPGEGTFLPCSFWMANVLHLLGRTEEARRLFVRLIGLANEVGLLSEEFDTGLNRMTGNFPQAFSHVAIINTAFHLSGHGGPTDGQGKP